MKLLHIISSVDRRAGGPIEAILALNRTLHPLVTSTIASCDEPGSTHLNDIQADVVPLGVPWIRTFNPISNFLQHYKYTPRFIPWLEANVEKFDAVIVHGVWNYTAYACRAILPKSGVPYFVFSHGQFDPWFRTEYPVKDIFKQIFWLFNEGPLLIRSCSVLYTCAEEQRLMKGRYVGHQKFRSTVVGLGTSPPPPRTEKQILAFRDLLPQLPCNARFLLFLSRIHKKKGCDMLLEAFARTSLKTPDVFLVMAGPDNDSWGEALKTKAKALGIENKVYWPGMITGEAKWGAFYSADAFVLPSHSENFGIVVAEAMACGTPVLISNRVNIWREVLESGGGLVYDDTTEGTQRMIEHWLSLNDDKRSMMKQSAKAGFSSNFDIQMAAARIIELIQRTKCNTPSTCKLH